MTSRAWGYAAVGIILFALVYLLLIPPIIGVADGGDYIRIASNAGLEPPPDLPYYDQYVCWVVTGFNKVPPGHFPYFMVGQFLAWVAGHLSPGSTMDIRWLAGVHVVLLMGIVVAISRCARKLPAAACAIVLIGLVLVSTDSAYISHFNSFYGESETVLGVLALVAAGLAAATADRISWRHLFTIAIAAAFFLGSKAQNTLPSLAAGVWLVWLFKDKPAHRYTSIAVGIALVFFAGFEIRKDAQPQFLFHAIYDRILPHSMDPGKTLTELGLSPETVVWKGKLYWDVKIESTGIYPGRASNLTLLTYYLRHPVVDFRIARDSLSLNNDVPYLGNYTKDSGAPCVTRTNAFTGYDRLRSRLASVWFVFPLIALNIIASLIWRNRMAGLVSTLGIMALLAFPLGGAFYDTEPRKHLLTFNLLFDVLLFADLSAGAVYLSQIRFIRKPESVLSGGLQMAAAVLLVPIAGFGLWHEASAKNLTEALVPDLALHKSTAQSSNLPGYPTAISASAVDGNTNGNLFRGSTTSTDIEKNPWWQMDLGTSRAIQSVVIWNRTDCCRERLQNYWVFLSDEPFLPADTITTLQDRAGIWKRFETTAPGPFTKVEIPGGKPARYVRVQLNGMDYLSLAEVQVFGR